MIVAIFGTTISPYLFFWQASEEAEEVENHADRASPDGAPGEGETELKRIELDTFAGMGASNLVALAIILTTAATLHATGSPTSRLRPRRPRRCARSPASMRR